MISTSLIYELEANVKKIKLGIIGLSEGNGHPYSWSAIINGYDPIVMADCPFPVIPNYLAKENFPDVTIKDAEVTHIWTQDINLSHHIAQATHIPHVVAQMEQMIPKIDGVLLARDDANQHTEMAKPFLEAGIPIYIDKPLALTCAEVDYLFSLQRYSGQLFTCSAFQYANELALANNEIKSKKISHIDAYIKNDWNKYAIHLIEPIIKLIGYHQQLINVTVTATETKKIANYLLSDGLTIQIKTFKEINVKPTINFFSEDAMTKIIFEDTFSAFKTALSKFIEGIIEKKEITKKAFILRCIEMIEKANKAA